jgi:hypothetical protein
LEHALAEHAVVAGVVEFEGGDVAAPEGSVVVAARRLASASMVWLASMPSTDPVGPTRPASARATSPVPQPASTR